MQFVRLTSNKLEIMIVPDRQYVLIVIQEPTAPKAAAPAEKK